MYKYIIIRVFTILFYYSDVIDKSILSETEDSIVLNESV